MRKIAVINQKGGVGKTTTTANLGAAFAASGQRLLLIDLDPQAHLTMHYGIDPDALSEEQATIYDVLTESVSIEEARVSPRDNVDILSAHIDLAGAETELVNAVGREVILRDALSAVEDQYDLVMIDCPPSLGLLTINALAACNEVVIPLQAHFLGLQGLSKLLDTVTLVHRRINPSIQISAIVLCMFETGTKLAGEVEEDIRGFLEGSRGTDSVWSQAHLCETRIRRNIKLAESPSYGQTVFDYAPISNGAQDYSSLAAEILGIQLGSEAQADKKEPDPVADVEQAPTNPTEDGSSSEVRADEVVLPSKAEKQADASEVVESKTQPDSPEGVEPKTQPSENADPGSKVIKAKSPTKRKRVKRAKVKKATKKRAQASSDAIVESEGKAAETVRDVAEPVGPVESAEPVEHSRVSVESSEECEAIGAVDDPEREVMGTS